jgi:hypothetical protein
MGSDVAPNAAAAARLVPIATVRFFMIFDLSFRLGAGRQGHWR